MGIEEVEKPKEQKKKRVTIKTPLKTTPNQRKARQLPRILNIEEVEEPKKHENYHVKPVSIAEHRKARELPRKANMRARKHENYHGSRSPPPI